MGYDISNHPVDVTLMHERLIPYIMGTGNIDDLFEKAINNNKVAHRANSWGLAVFDLDSTISEEQRDVATPRTQTITKDVNPTFWDKFLKRNLSQQEEIEFPGETTGLIGFDSDLHIWGRPYFNIGANAEETLEIYDTYLKLVGQPIEKVDEFIVSLLQKLNIIKKESSTEVEAQVLEILERYYPIEEHLTLEDDGFDYNQQDLISPAQNMMQVLKYAYENLGTDIKIPLSADEEYEQEEDEEEEQGTPEEILQQAPLDLINIASQLLPGWMGRGYVWPTILFNEINVDISDIFETPEALFQPLIEKVPSVKEYLSTTIEGNFSIGGYVPPEKMEAFVSLLEEHKRELVLAWYDDKQDVDESRDIFHTMSNDYQKIYEPALYAAKNGLGFIEAAEVYSGPLGWMN